MVEKYKKFIDNLPPYKNTHGVNMIGGVVKKGARFRSGGRFTSSS